MNAPATRTISIRARPPIAAAGARSDHLMARRKWWSRAREVLDVDGGDGSLMALLRDLRDCRCARGRNSTAKKCEQMPGQGGSPWSRAMQIQPDLFRISR